MGGSLATVRNILQSPLTEEQLRSCLGPVQEGKVEQWCNMLLSGQTLTNFAFADMCLTLNNLSGDDFIILPVWTLTMPNAQSGAMCVLKHWSDSVPQENLRNTRVMLPIFKEGHPIGHARFLFFDVWQPMPEVMLLQERNDCMEFLQEVIPEEGICRLILFEYEGLCPTRHQTESGTIKIIDSMPGNVQTFAKEATLFEDVLRVLQDASWEPREGKKDYQPQLDHIRQYLSAMKISDATSDTAEDIESILLPSTRQMGLECIIITICRVIATWVNPSQIPLENCSELCVNKKGRRILSQLLLLSTGDMDDFLMNMSDVVSQTPVTLIDESVEESLTTPDAEEATMESLDLWYAVYTVPTFQVLSRDSDATPYDIKFNGTVGYQVYKDCKWVHEVRSQSFTPLTTVLALGDHLGCLFICPVRNTVEGKWYFALLGHQGYHLFPVDGKTIKNSGGKKNRLHFKNGADIMARDPTWKAPVHEDDAFMSFLSSLEDGTWRQDTYASKSKTEVVVHHDVSMLEHTTDSESTPRRRSKRTPKPRILAVEVTPVCKHHTDLLKIIDYMICRNLANEESL